jgi:hypothetical protein
MFLHRLASMVRWIVNRKRVEAELDDELQTFVEMAAADQVRDGATPAEGRRLAARRSLFEEVDLCRNDTPRVTLANPHL